MYLQSDAREGTRRGLMTTVDQAELRALVSDYERMAREEFDRSKEYYLENRAEFEGK